MPVGIENFALGLIQGMNQRKADQRQEEQDAMRKQEFDLQQQARTLDIENARTTAANNKVDRDRALGIQARGDAFNKHFGQAYAMAQSGDADGAINTLASGFNDPVFGLPYRAVPQTDPDGKPVKDKDGKYLIGYTDPSGNVVRTDAWTLDDALSGFRGINDAASQFDKVRESSAKKQEKSEDRAHDIAKIDREGAWSLKKSEATSAAALDRALESIRLRGELGAFDGGGGEKSKYDLGKTVSALIKDSPDASPLMARVIVDQVGNGMELATRGKDAATRAEGWNRAFKGFVDTVRNADHRKKMTPQQIDEQARNLFSEYLTENYGVGYDDAMKQLGIVRASSLPKPGSQAPAKKPVAPASQAQALIDPVRQQKDKQAAYQQANNFITGGGF